MLSSKTKIGITAISFIILFICLAIFVVSPVLGGLRVNARNLGLQRVSLDLFDSQLQALKDFQEKQPMYQGHLAKIEDGFVDPKAPIGFVEFLEAQANEANLELKISASAISQTEHESKFNMAFSIVLGGAFPECLRFLEQIEYSPWLVEISQINITRVAEKARGARDEQELLIGDVSFTVHLKAFNHEILSVRDSYESKEQNN